MNTSAIIQALIDLIEAHLLPYYIDTTYSETTQLIMIPINLNQIHITVWDGGVLDALNIPTQVHIGFKTIRGS